MFLFESKIFHHFFLSYQMKNDFLIPNISSIAPCITKPKLNLFSKNIQSTQILIHESILYTVQSLVK
jgi:hypothetical protein